MTIVTTSTYEPCKGASADEQGILILLRDVKVNIAEFSSSIHSIDDILNFIERGKFEKRKGNSEQVRRLDLSAAKEIVDKYKRKSEGGCQSCVYKEIFKPHPDEGGEYCKKHEPLKENEYVGKSPRLEQYWEKGCEDRKPILPPLTEILARVKE